MPLRCLSSRRTREGFDRRTYTAAEVDALAAYCPELETCYLVPIECVESRQELSLRLTPTRNGQSGAIVWAKDFEFSGVEWQPSGAVAQWEERRYGIPEAGGSSPPSSTSRPTAARTVGAHEFRNHFGYHLERAAAGESFS